MTKGSGGQLTNSMTCCRTMSSMILVVSTEGSAVSPETYIICRTVLIMSSRGFFCDLADGWGINIGGRASCSFVSMLGSGVGGIWGCCRLRAEG